MSFRETISAVWNYLKNSWEDEQGHLSYKRVSQFIWSWLIVITVLKGTITGRWEFYTLLALMILFSITATLITVPQVIEMIKNYSGSKLTDDEEKKPSKVPDNPDK